MQLATGVLEILTNAHVVLLFHVAFALLQPRLEIATHRGVLRRDALLELMLPHVELFSRLLQFGLVAHQIVLVSAKLLRVVVVLSEQVRVVANKICHNLGGFVFKFDEILSFFLLDLYG